MSTDLSRLEPLLTRGDVPPPRFAVSQIRCETIHLTMRDGILLATDIYRPPVQRCPVVVVRTPYGRSAEDRSFVGALLFFARQGYAVVSQDCRGTGESEPEHWDYYVYESEDGYDLVDWVVQQEWCNGFVGSFGASYVGQTQWCMALHPAMSTIVPIMSGLGIASGTTHLYMFLNAYARSIGRGEDKVPVPYYEMERVYLEETLAGGFFNEPLHVPFSAALRAAYPEIDTLSPSRAKRRLWERYAALTSVQRVQFIQQALGTTHVTSVDVENLSSVFGQRVAHDAHTIPHADPKNLCKLIQAPPLLRTGWYDWFLNDALATWELFRREATPTVAQRARLLITPYAHNMPGYHEGVDLHPELLRVPNTLDYVALLLRWYEAIQGNATDTWPTVIYYLMGANEWRAASDWPVPEAVEHSYYLHAKGMLLSECPPVESPPDNYLYDPSDPTPTVGGSIVSFIYPPGSVDVRGVQIRSDVLTYTSTVLRDDVDVVGPLRMILYASSSAVDTDFVARLSDVFPDGRAIQIQNGVLRARYRRADGEPERLDPGRIYCFEIDMWATANRFRKGHCLRVDISSADFPRYDRHSNRGGEPAAPVAAHQTVYHDAEHPSRFVFRVLQTQTVPADRENALPIATHMTRGRTAQMRGRELLQSSIVWDNHACMPLRTDATFLPQLGRLHRAGVTLVSLNIGFGDISWQEHVRVLSYMRRWIATHAQSCELVSSVAQIRRCKDEGKLAVVFDIEGMRPVEDNLSLVQTFYELGVRWMLIAYNKNNAAGGGCLDEDTGLTAAGRAIIDEMERVGMVLCLSHSGKRTATEALEYCRNPPIFSHSNPWGHTPHPRNVADDLVLACARKGGVIGLSGIGMFLGTREHLVERLLSQMQYLIDRVGPAHLGLGLDFVYDTREFEAWVRANPDLFPEDLVSAGTLPMIPPEDMESIAEGLARDNLSDDEIRGILGGNWLRVASIVWR